VEIRHGACHREPLLGGDFLRGKIFRYVKRTSTGIDDSFIVVDDDPHVRAVAADTLTGSGHKVGTARDGVDALYLLKHHAYNVIVSDLGMPILDGPGLYQAPQRQYPAVLPCSARRDRPTSTLSALADRRHDGESMDAQTTREPGRLAGGIRTPVEDHADVPIGGADPPEPRVDFVLVASHDDEPALWSAVRLPRRDPSRPRS
jgi:CheY-like chemotaxis protein